MLNSIASPQPVVTGWRQICNRAAPRFLQSIVEGDRNKEEDMKARAHRLIGTLVVAITATGALAGAVLAQAAPDWIERAAGVGTSTVGVASPLSPPPDWAERAINRGGAGSDAAAITSTAVSPPDWAERAALRAIGR
jgi:hypothetical protein